MGSYRIIDADVCIVGGGGAGMVAAIRAREMGVEKVVVLERNKMLGGSSRCFSSIMGINTPMHRRYGIHIDIPKVFLEQMKVQNWNSNAKLVSRWYNTSGEVFAWLEGLGVVFTELLDSGNYGDRDFLMQHVSHGLGINIGAQICRHLEPRLKELGVEVLRSTPGRHLIAEDGVVKGVLAEGPDGTVQVNAKRVLISTGSISYNQELVRTLVDPRRLGDITICEAAKPFNNGEGYTMAKEVGAKTGNITVMYCGPHQHPYSNAVCTLMRRPSVMAVNANGERYVNESIISAGGGYQWMRGNALQQQKKQVEYTIVDSAYLKQMIEHPQYESVLEKTLAIGNFGANRYQEDNITGEINMQKLSVGQRRAWLGVIMDDLRSEAEAGRVLIADTLDEVAAWIGADPDTLKNEVAKYNQACEFGYDGEFGKEAKNLRPVKTPPYYVIKAWQGADNFIGGVQIDHRLRVLGQDDEPIEGLYCAGVTASGFVGYGYSYPGTESSFAITSGYMAAQEMVEGLL